MKKSLAIILLLFITVAIFAQTQQGYVKTKGRMINGKYVPGSGLVGATVTVKGRSALTVQNRNGFFSFVVPAQQFTVQSVQKKGYEIIDNDVLRRVYNHSKNPIYLVMETPDRQMEDLLDEKEKMRNQFNEQLKKARAEIKKLRDENQISQEEYNRRLQQILDNQNNSEKHISELAQYYATLDYDQLDEKDRVIEDCINNGEFERADSLIRSKGDLQSRHEEVMREKELEEQREKELEKQQQELADSKEGTRKKMEALAEDYYRLFNLAKSQLNFDTATYYIVRRAELDKKNPEWQNDAGFFLMQRGEYALSKDYFTQALLFVQHEIKNNGRKLEPVLAYTLLCLGSLNFLQHMYTESEQMYIQTLEIYKKLAKEESKGYNIFIALTMSELGDLYGVTQRLSESEQMFTQALEIYLQSLKENNTDENLSMIANTMCSLAIAYGRNLNFDDSKLYFEQALVIYKELVNKDPSFCTDANFTLFCLEELYQINKRHIEIERHYKQFMDIYQCNSLVSTNTLLFKDNLAIIMGRLAIVYYENERLNDSERMHRGALKIRKHLATIDPTTYEPSLAMEIDNFAILMLKTQKYSECKQLYEQALEIYKRLAKDSKSWDPYVAETMERLALLFHYTHQFTESAQMYMQALEIYKRLAKDDPYSYDLAIIMSNLSYSYIFMKKYILAEQYAKESLSVSPQYTTAYTNLATAQLLLGKYDEAKAIYLQYKDELKDSFLEDLQAFEEAGVIPEDRKEDVEKIRQLLTE